VLFDFGEVEHDLISAVAIGDAELQIAYIGACNVQRVFVFPSLGI